VGQHLERILPKPQLLLRASHAALRIRLPQMQ
jgi:hypothetical protein